jgi:hypothetical protein
MMGTRAALHTLVDELPDPELQAARRFLEYLRLHGANTLRSVLDAAPLDDEPVTANDLAAMREGLEDMERGEVVSHEEAMRLLREVG